MVTRSNLLMNHGGLIFSKQCAQATGRKFPTPDESLCVFAIKSVVFFYHELGYCPDSQTILHGESGTGLPEELCSP